MQRRKIVKLMAGSSALFMANANSKVASQALSMRAQAQSLWNDAVVSTLQPSPAFIAYMNDHKHTGSYSEKDGKHYLNFKGMVETKNKSAYGIGSKPDRTLKT